MEMGIESFIATLADPVTGALYANRLTTIDYKEKT
jgi:hypothetical protein